jgi:enoyl-CoA hydratase/carnithine racemase
MAAIREEAMDFETLRLELADAGIATLTLHRPEALNAWNGRMAYEVDQALRALDQDDRARVVVVTGAGRAFCAGADLSGGDDRFAAGPDATRPGHRERGPVEQAMWPFLLRKPVIAAINGHAIGVGITFPMTCDVRFVAEDAKLQFAFVRRGVIPELASHVIVPRVVGLSSAADLLLTGRIFRGREAAERGLASRALPAEQVLPAAREHAREYLQAAPVSVAISKRLLWEGLTTAPLDMMRREMPLFHWSGAQPDAREGVQSFLEKREPRWQLRPGKDLPQEL